MNKPVSEYKQSPEPPLESDVRETGTQGRRRRSRQSHLEASVNMDELRELISLIQENGFAEFELEREGFRIHVRRDLAGSEAAASSAGAQVADAAPTPPANAASSGAKASATPDHPGARAETAASEDQDLHMIPSPIVGTFYRSASPNSDPFVKIGSSVEPDSVVCIIEAMKLMNEIQAETSGEVVKIYVENGQPVEYGQPLFGIKS
ncbi:MAG TPA: acetyl-CoA carboxylase biotin carboxyl carrier protein [Pyrinomonadaceae bacterium]|nr:acetyl-CoA carboxylase biotin carboxyl carrier protein [Pyrinomonadaceae bacterium]